MLFEILFNEGFSMPLVNTAQPSPFLNQQAVLSDFSNFKWPLPNGFCSVRFPFQCLCFNQHLLAHPVLFYFTIWFRLLVSLCPLLLGFDLVRSHKSF